MVNVSADDDGVKSSQPRILIDRIEPVTKYFWSRRDELTRHDLDTIDGTFLDSCCQFPDSYKDLIERLIWDDLPEDPPDHGPMDEKIDGWVSPTSTGGLHNLAVVTPPTSGSPAWLSEFVQPMMPPASIVGATVIDREWTGAAVEAELRRRHFSIAPPGPLDPPDLYRRLPLTVVQAPAFHLVQVDSPFEEGEDEDPVWGIRVLFLVHGTSDGFPVPGLIAKAYDAVADPWGWRERLRASMRNQEPAQAIRGWAIALQMRSGTVKSEKAAVEWFEDHFKDAESHSVASFRDARDNIIQRCPGASFLKRAKRRNTPPEPE